MSVDHSPFACTGKAGCVGGIHEVPPIDSFPLLAWRGNHPKFGDKVFLCDQTASADEIALALAETPDISVLASRFGTTDEHVSQAIAYSVKTGLA